MLDLRPLRARSPQVLLSGGAVAMLDGLAGAAIDLPPQGQEARHAAGAARRLALVGHHLVRRAVDLEHGHTVLRPAGVELTVAAGHRRDRGDAGAQLTAHA